MLDRFLFIGVGGSGGKTLRVVRHELERRLREAGYPDGIPKAWQFLYVDVPFEQEDDDPRLPGPLPEECYVRLTERGLSYSDIDFMLQRRSADLLEHLAGWRPAGDQVDVDVLMGAGQYRAIGRVVAVSSMPDIVNALSAARNRLEQADVHEELARASHQLGDPSTSVHPYPLVVVVGSLSGGSGAGVLIDLCDALRSFGAGWDRSAAVLYTPDVFSFDEIPPARRAGVSPNAIATISELLAAYWDGEPSANSLAVLATATSTRRVNRRGPRYCFLIGSGERVRFSRQSDVYLAVGRALASWVSSRKVLNELRQVIMGNWQSAATAELVPDHTNLAPGRERPFSSFGHASISLGRQDRFADYATDRLAGESVHVVLRGHRPLPSEPSDDGDRAALERTVAQHFDRFVSTCGLGSLDKASDQVVEQLRGGERKPARIGRFTAIEQQITAKIAAGREGAVRPEELARIVDRRVKEARSEFVDGELSNDREHALRWVQDVQRRVVAASARLVGAAGLPATIRIVDHTIAGLRERSVPELRRLAELDRRRRDRVPSPPPLPADANRRKVPLKHPVTAKLVERAAERYFFDAEARLLELAADLLDELARNFLGPLRLALEHTRLGLEQDAIGHPDHPSAVQRWQQRYVPADHLPAQNEFLLEQPSAYPQAFDRLVHETCGTTYPNEARRQAAAEVACGATADEPQQMIGIRQAWWPENELLAASQTPRRPAFDITLGATVLHRNAGRWARRRGRAMGDFIHMSLQEYLDDPRADRREQDRRLAMFKAAFAQLVARSLPFAALDAGMLSQLHNQQRLVLKRLSTEIPFPDGHPARPIVEDVFAHEGVDLVEVQALFDSSGRPRIEMTTFLDSPYNPLAFKSLTETVAKDTSKWRSTPDSHGFWRWRRARPLAQFIPLPPDQRLAMIRGWFVAGALEQLQSSLAPGRGRRVSIWIPRLGPRPFPFPLLGEPPDEWEEVLPALLETLPLALFDAARDMSVLAPYWRLAELGAATHDGRPLPHPELRSWVVEGKPVAGISNLSAAPRWAGADDWRARLEALEERFIRESERYQQLIDAYDIDLLRNSRIPSAWELRADVLSALEDLQLLCERLDKNGNNDDG